MNFKAHSFFGALALIGLAVGAFAAGIHLGPNRSVGHNLYHPAFSSRLSTHKNVVLASVKTPVRMASADSTIDDEFTSDGPADTFQQVYLLLKRHYVDQLPDDFKMGHGAASSMLASLQDPNSRFLEPAEMAELNNEAKGQYHGLGAVLAVRKIAHVKSEDIPQFDEYRLTIVAALPGSPAEKAGLKAGDYIIDINGQWVYSDDPVYAETKSIKAAENDPVAFNKLVTALQKKIDSSLSLADAQTKLDDPLSKSLALTVARPGVAQPLNVNLDTTAPTIVPPIVAHSLPGGIGYIRINQFTEGADKDFATALSGFGTDVKGLVLDLRDSPGGMLETGAAIAAQISTATSLGVVQTKGKKEADVSITPSNSLTKPVVVLVNGGTANTAELLAAVLQSKGDKLVGATTFGDAADVKAILLRDGSGFTMTVGKVFTAAHGDFADIGLKPDVPVADTTGNETLNRAVGLLSGQVARAPSHRG